MNPEKHRIFLLRIEIGGFNEPALQVQSVRGLEPELFRVSQCDIGQDVLVYIDQFYKSARFFRVKGNQIAGPVKSRYCRCSLTVFGYRQFQQVVIAPGDFSLLPAF